MKKREVKAIRDIAKLLPARKYEFVSRKNYIKLFSRPTIIRGDVNHVLRLKRAYKKFGQLGINDYCSKLNIDLKRVSEIWLSRLFKPLKEGDERL